MTNFKIYVVFHTDNGNGTASHIGKYTHVTADDIVSAIQKVQNDPKYNKFSKAVIKSAKQEA